MAEQFGVSAIKPIRWGEVRELPTGRWLTCWTIELEMVDGAQLERVAALATHDSSGFSPRLTEVGPHVVKAEIETTRWGMELDYYDLTYRLLSLIDCKVGRVRAFQGTPRDWWRPFRSA